MCHDVTLFSFIPPAKYAYRAIASFSKAITLPDLDITAPRPPDMEQIKDSLAHSARLSMHQKKFKNLKSTIYSGDIPSHRPSFENGMIRERISIRGVVRKLEPASELNACKLGRSYQTRS